MGDTVMMYFIAERSTLWVRSFATKAEHEYESTKKTIQCVGVDFSFSFPSFSHGAAATIVLWESAPTIQWVNSIRLNSFSINSIQQGRLGSSLSLCGCSHARFMPPLTIDGGGIMFSGRPSGCPSVVRPLTRISRAAIFLFSRAISMKIEMRFQWKLVEILSVWVCIAEKVFKVRGQRSR